MIEQLLEKYLVEKVDKKKENWMKVYQDELAKRSDHKPGRVDWDTATYLYNSGMDAKEAAKNVKEPYKR